MNCKKFLALTLALLIMASFLAGCGAAAKNEAMVAPEAAAPMEDVIVETWAETEMVEVEEESLTSSSESGSAPLPVNKKIITTMYIDAQTEDMTTLLQQINGKIGELGGYIEAQEVYNGSSYDSYRYRYAYITVRIPADKLHQFVENVSVNANVISENTSIQDVTLTYVATESRIKALETEQTRLLELMEMAENMEDLLLIESRLTEVRTELEQVQSALRTYDNQINYSTVHLDLTEVKEYTDTEEPETVWQRIAKGFSRSLKDLGEGLTDFFVFLVVGLPYFVLIGIIVVVVVLILRAVRRKHPRKKKNKVFPQDGPSEEK